MAIYRQIQTLFWQDGFVAELTPEEKYFFFYLLTNSRTAQCGIFEINIRIMEAETGYNRETIEKLIKRFVEYGKILYCKETREIMILNWMKYNFINSKNTMCCMNKELKAVKNKEFVNKLYKICLDKGYDAAAIFEGIFLSTEEKTDPVVEDNINEENLSINRGLEGANKPLGEKEIKEEIYIQKESSSTEIVINNKVKHKSNSDKILEEYNKNIRQATINDIEKMSLWLKDFEEDVIIQAILAAVKYGAPHIGYLESIVKSWRGLGLFTMEKLKNYREKSKKGSVNKRANEDAYKYLD